MDTTKKLTFSKQTLRPLGEEALSQAKGGNADITILDLCSTPELISMVMSCADIDCSPGPSTSGYSCAKVGMCC